MDLDRAMFNPASVFASPGAVCDAQDLSHAQKVEILRRWEYDARELQVAAEENMGEGSEELLDEILAALHQLGAGIDLDNSPPTKQGGF
ncbi:hypothetical protein XM38_024140 [Halomicronema hongdechloris C2206]|uniref:Nucleotide pyrophosphohydrolase n=1 Tax=Halomicronema hongdechloris C2206 TaxID=1641165 RepID=A0A1Z3HMB7_9CYAN|nr:hypothetical protein [Halomicronema hongdechloris]ASC71462.1 hypothetical protein XM38_024140 [Halomicronema hongdechloris C2206]